MLFRSMQRFLNDVSVKEEKMETSLRLKSLHLDPENIARVVPGRITDVRFFPSTSVKMIAAGNRFGHIGFWNVGQRVITGASTCTSGFQVCKSDGGGGWAR